MTGRKTSHVAWPFKSRVLVPPLEPLGTARHEQEPRHALRLHLDETVPREPDLVLPEPAVTPDRSSETHPGCGDSPSMPIRTGGVRPPRLTLAPRIRTA